MMYTRVHIAAMDFAGPDPNITASLMARSVGCPGVPLLAVLRGSWDLVASHVVSPNGLTWISPIRSRVTIPVISSY